MCEDCGRHGDDAESEPGVAVGRSRSKEPNPLPRRVEGGEETEPSRREHTMEEAAALSDLDGTVRLAVTGKGGVGKTTLSAAIASQLAAHQSVVAVDADPDMNLAGTLGVEAPPPITAQRALIEERAGAGGLVNLTPEVADVIDSHSTRFGAAGRLLTIGAPSGANTGCMCPENSFVRSLVSTALGEDAVVMDMEAGVEHLGRGTADAVDAMLVVVEPSQASIDTATRIADLATDLGIEDVWAVVNKARGNADVVASKLPVPVLATLPYDEEVAGAALAGVTPVDKSDDLERLATTVVSALATPSRAVPAER